MTSARPRIALLAAPETSASILYGLYDVLLSVGAVYPDMTAGEAGDALLDVVIVAESATPFRCFGGILVEPGAALAAAGDVDVAVVCDMYTPIHTAPRGRYEAEMAWLRQRHAAGALIASVCTGSLLLAESGLLDGRSCAGHWAYADLYRAEYPRVRFDASAVLDLSQEADNVVTAAGVTAWQDLALYLIARLCGPEHAVRTAKVYLLGGHESGQLPYSAMTRPRTTDDAAIRRAMAWIDDHYAEPNPVAAMCERSGLTRRTFARRFVAATGRRPIDYVHAVRMEHARRRIEAGRDPVDDVGLQVGYEDPAFFRRLFKRSTGLTPTAYRRRFEPIVTGRAAPSPMRVLAHGSLT